MKKRILLIVAVVLIAVLIAPLLSSVGFWRTVHEWQAPAGTFGSDRQISLSVEQFQSIGDPLMIFGGGRAVLSDGISEYAVRVDLNFFPPVSETAVSWEDDSVTLVFPGGVAVQLPGSRLIQITD